MSDDFKLWPFPELSEKENMDFINVPENVSNLFHYIQKKLFQKTPNVWTEEIKEIFCDKLSDLILYDYEKIKDPQIFAYDSLPIDKNELIYLSVNVFQFDIIQYLYEKDEESLRNMFSTRNCSIDSKIGNENEYNKLQSLICHLNYNKESMDFIFDNYKEILFEPIIEYKAFIPEKRNILHVAYDFDSTSFFYNLSFIIGKLSKNEQQICVGRFFKEISADVETERLLNNKFINQWIDNLYENTNTEVLTRMHECGAQDLKASGYLEKKFLEHICERKQFSTKKRITSKI